MLRLSLCLKWFATDEVPAGEDRASAHSPGTLLVVLKGGVIGGVESVMREGAVMGRGESQRLSQAIVKVWSGLVLLLVMRSVRPQAGGQAGGVTCAAGAGGRRRGLLPEDAKQSKRGRGCRRRPRIRQRSPR